MYYLFIFAFSFFIAVLIIPSIIQIAKARRLYDDPEQTLKIHTGAIPRLGGVAIFLSFTLTLLLWGFSNPLLQINYLLAACTLLFVLGLNDDLTGLGHCAKFSMELIAALLLSIGGNIRLYSLHGLFNIYELSYCSSIALSVLVLVFLINAFNLIDGIDGLAAATGIMAHLAFAALFIYMQQGQLAAVSLSLAGALVGFLKFNLTPARIFMGDTGSLLTGLISAVMALKFIELSTNGGLKEPLSPPLTLMISLAIFILPVTDTLSVFITRLANGKSPFKGDLNHIHHKILRHGFTHLQSTAILILLNAVAILIAFAALYQPCFNGI